MSNDLAIIKKIDNKLKFSLQPLDLEALKEPIKYYHGHGINLNRGYHLNEKGQVVGLRLPYTNLSIITDLLMDLKNVQDAFLVYAFIPDTSTIIGNWTQLTSLDLSSNKQIKDFTFIKDLTQLTSLSLSDNKQIKDFTFIKDLTQLTSLYLSDNKQIKDFTFIKDLTQLTSLSLSDNKQIKDFTFIKDLTQLTSLYLSYNKQIKDFTFTKDLTQLTSLDLSYNNISDATFIKDLTQLTSLYLSDNNISDATFIKDLTQLTSLDLSYNKQIKDFTFTKDLTQLTSLYLSSNNISDATFIKDLTQLTSLYLSYNNISDATFIKDLTQLTSLSLSDNKQIKDFTFIKDLTQLTSLYLSSNNISDATFIKDLTQLTSLSLSDNNISVLPFELEQLSNVQNLNLAHNQLKKIPRSIFANKKSVITNGRFSNTGLNLTENPIETPPLEIINKGIRAVHDYFQQLDNQGEAYLYEAKLLIVGKGGAGKTSLARKLIEEDADLPNEEETTKGIDIHRLIFQTKDGEDFTVHIWDFGGQEIYHATHQFFLTKRSLYVLVDDTREDEKSLHDPSFNYWLQTVKVFGGDSALLIIQNQKGDRSKDIDLQSMQAQFSNIKACHGTNLLTRYNLSQVKEAIIYHVQQLPHIGQILPAQWVNIRDHLETLEVPYIPLEKYYQICAEHQISDKDQALHLSQYLHDLGVFLHFQEDSLLRKTVILQNDWATEAAYRILDDEAIKKAKGRFGNHEIRTLWSDSTYQDMHGELLQLMKNFELCYELQGLQEERYLIPQLLPLSRPTSLVWEDDKDQLQLRYRYSFMPRGLLSRFIVRLHRYVIQPELAWKNGVVLEREDTQALVTAPYSQREIMITVIGKNRKAFMTIIKEELDILNSIFEGIEVEKRIPCNCSVCTGNNEPYFYKYRSLLKRKLAKQLTVQCDISYEDVPVLQLIDDVFLQSDVHEDHASGDTLQILAEVKEELKVIKESRTIENKVEIKLPPPSSYISSPPPPPPSPSRWYEAWWVKSLAGGIGGGLVVAILAFRLFSFPFLDSWLVAAAVLGAIMLLRNPKYRYFRLASLALGIFSTLNLLPALDATYKITEKNEIKGFTETLFQLGLKDSPLISIGLLVLVAWLVYHDPNRK